MAESALKMGLRRKAKEGEEGRRRRRWRGRGQSVSRSTASDFMHCMGAVAVPTPTAGKGAGRRRGRGCHIRMESQFQRRNKRSSAQRSEQKASTVLLHCTKGRPDRALVFPLNQTPPHQVPFSPLSLALCRSTSAEGKP